MVDHTELKQRLEAELTELKAELTTIATLEPVTGDWVAVPAKGTGNNADENVAADTAEDWGERRATVAQIEMRYQNIDRALKKFADGSFGICEISQAPIEDDRLMANPAARTCKLHLERERELPQ